MAQAKLGPLISDVAGSIGGTTLQRAPFGTLLRRKPLPILRRSVTRTTPRSRWQWLSREWSQLTSAQRADWEILALTLSWTNRFGDPITGRGQWLYMRSNMYLWTWDGGYIADAPTVSPVADLIPESLTIEIGAGTFELGWASGDTAANTPCLVYVSEPVRASVMTPRKGYRYVGYIPENTGSPFNLFSMVDAAGLAGTMPAGNYMCKFISIDQTTGIAGSPQADTYPFIY